MSIMGMLWFAVTPFVSMLILKKIMKKAGLGNLFKPSEALSMATNAMGRAGGTKQDLSATAKGNIKGGLRSLRRGAVKGASLGAKSGSTLRKAGKLATKASGAAWVARAVRKKRKERLNDPKRIEEKRRKKAEKAQNRHKWHPLNWSKRNNLDPATGEQSSEAGQQGGPGRLGKAAGGLRDKFRAVRNSTSDQARAMSLKAGQKASRLKTGLARVRKVDVVSKMEDAVKARTVKGLEVLRQDAIDLKAQQIDRVVSAALEAADPSLAQSEVRERRRYEQAHLKGVPKGELGEERREFGASIHQDVIRQIRGSNGLGGETETRISAGALETIQKGYRKELAKTLKIDAGSIPMDLIKVDPLSGVPMIPPTSSLLGDKNLPLALRTKIGQSPLLMLDKKTIQRQVDEDEEQHTARLFATMVRTGMIGSNASGVPAVLDGADFARVSQEQWDADLETLIQSGGKRSVGIFREARKLKVSVADSSVAKYIASSVPTQAQAQLQMVDSNLAGAVSAQQNFADANAGLNATVEQILTEATRGHFEGDQVASSLDLALFTGENAYMESVKKSLLSAAKAEALTKKSYAALSPADIREVEESVDKQMRKLRKRAQSTFSAISSGANANDIAATLEKIVVDVSSSLDPQLADAVVRLTEERDTARQAESMVQAEKSPVLAGNFALRDPSPR